MTSDFAIALHILGYLTSRGGGPVTSTELASSYGTNPVVIRRVQSKLAMAGLVASRRGSGGGCMLARPPELINLREVYEAVSAKPQLLPRHPKTCQEVVPIVVGRFVNEVCSNAEKALLRELARMTVKEMDATIRTRITQEMKARPEA